MHASRIARGERPSLRLLRIPEIIQVSKVVWGSATGETKDLQWRKVTWPGSEALLTSQGEHSLPREIMDGPSGREEERSNRQCLQRFYNTIADS